MNIFVCRLQKFVLLSFTSIHFFAFILFLVLSLFFFHFRLLSSLLREPVCLETGFSSDHALIVSSFLVIRHSTRSRPPRWTIQSCPVTQSISFLYWGTPISNVTWWIIIALIVRTWGVPSSSPARRSPPFQGASPRSEPSPTCWSSHVYPIFCVTLRALLTLRSGSLTLFRVSEMSSCLIVRLIQTSAWCWLRHSSAERQCGMLSRSESLSVWWRPSSWRPPSSTTSIFFLLFYLRFDYFLLWFIFSSIAILCILQHLGSIVVFCVAKWILYRF